jgi:asparagine synthase (glutamine-hydrolysing)
MSVIFGFQIGDNSVVQERDLTRVAAVTSRYGPDGTDVFCCRNVGMGFQAFHTDAKSSLGSQPCMDRFGNILVLDGRLDNRQDLAAMTGAAGEVVSDPFLILKAFELWGEDCFSHFVGDWALALWCARDSALFLARDHAGSRSLYYRFDHERITWSTYLETFFVDHPSPSVNRQYIARVLSNQPVQDLTPYEHIKSVPPAHYVLIQASQERLRFHWRWISKSTISYRTDAEYDEHFLHLFRQAVQRRIQPIGRVLAELSGGMDSSSIVCVADKITGVNHQVDTLSYYDDTEPDWNEQPYFTAVEQHRGKVGIHLDCSERRLDYEPLLLSDRLYPYPIGDREALEWAAQYQRALGQDRYRVIVSGIGGDELLGGVPTPMPELANYLIKGKVYTLMSRAFDWSLASRQPLLHMLRDTVSFTYRLYGPPEPEGDAIPPWLSPELRQSCMYFPIRDAARKALDFTSPSSLFNAQAWWSVLDTLPHLQPHLLGCYEYRYPYLDRDLVEFLHRIPRTQLVQPRRRRFLMRRALREIVPEIILERKRKAYISHGPLAQLRGSHQKIEALFSAPLSSKWGLIDQRKFLTAFRLELAGELKWVGHLTKTIGVELWLRSLDAQADQPVRFR